MNTLCGTLFVVLQLGFSLRFNEEVDLAVADGEMDTDEGRRRRRRRRRRRSGVSPSSRPRAATTFFEDFLALPPGTYTLNAGTSTIHYPEGWMVLAVAKDGEDAIWHGGETTNLNSKKAYWFETRFALLNLDGGGFFIGFAPVGYVATDSKLLNGVGILHLVATPTDVFFHADDAAAEVLKKFQTKMVGGVDLVLIEATVHTQSLTQAAGPKTGIHTLGWSFIPLGQFGTPAIAVSVGSLGEYRLFSERIQVGMHQAVKSIDDGELCLTTGVQGRETATTLFHIDYVHHNLV